MDTNANSTVVDRIISAALTVLATRTISNTRMHLLAEEADMVASNIHYYFKTKTDLLLAVLDEIQRRSFSRRRRIMDLAEDSLESKLSGFFESKKESILKDQSADIIQFDFWVQGLADENLRKRFQNNFNAWRKDITDVMSEYVPELTKAKKEILAYIMVSMMMGASMQYFYDNSFDLNDYFATCFEMLLKML